MSEDETARVAARRVLRAQRRRVDPERSAGPATALRLAAAALVCALIAALAAAPSLAH